MGSKRRAQPAWKRLTPKGCGITGTMNRTRAALKNQIIEQLAKDRGITVAQATILSWEMPHLFQGEGMKKLGSEIERKRKRRRSKRAKKEGEQAAKVRQSSHLDSETLWGETA